MPSACPVDLSGGASFVCTANDIIVSNFSIANYPVNCTVGDTFTADVVTTLGGSTNGLRYDIGIFLLSSGGDILSSGGQATCDLTVAPAGSPFASHDADACGDVTGQGAGDGFLPLVWDLASQQISCIPDATGVKVTALVDYSQSDTSVGCGPYIPDGGSKCSIDDAFLPMEPLGKLTVIKQATPDDGLPFELSYSVTDPPTTVTNPVSPFNLVSGASQDIFVDLRDFSATATVTETARFPYTFSTVNCVDALDGVTPVPATKVGNTFNVDITDAVPQVECTVVNSAPAFTDLSITKTDSVDPVFAGDPLTWTVQVDSTGPSDATNVVVTDTLPAGVTLVSTTGCAEDPNGVPACTLGTIPAGGSASYTIQVAVDPGLSGTITNTATVTSDILDIDGTNNTVTEDTLVTPAADLSVVKTTLTSPVVPGEPVSYTVAASNGGPSTVTDAAVADTFAPPLLNCTYTAAATAGTPTGFTPSGSGAISDTLTLAPGDQVTYTVTCDVDPAATGTASNTATIASAAVPDPVPANNTSTVSDPLSPSADLSVAKTTLTSPVVPGEPVSYTVVASNGGPSTVTDAAVADTFAPPLLNCTYTAAATAGTPTGFTPSGSGAISDTLTLAPGDQVTYTVTCDVDSAATGTASNTATIASAAVPDPVPANNTSTVSDPLSPSADLSVAKTTLTSPVVPGEPVSYTIVAANAGSSTVVDAAVSDTFAAPLLNCTYTAAATAGTPTGFTPSGSGAISDTLTLAPGDQVTYTVTCDVDSAATGTASNTATIASAAVPDPVPADNTSTVSDPLSPSADLSVAKTTLTSPVVPGEPVSYTIVAANAGSSTVTDAAVADIFAAPLLNCTYTAAATAGTPTGFTPSGSGSIADTLTLAPGDQVTYTVTCDVDPAATGTVDNTATIASAAVPDPVPANNTSTVSRSAVTLGGSVGGQDHADESGGAG